MYSNLKLILIFVMQMQGALQLNGHLRNLCLRLHVMLQGLRPKTFGPGRGTGGMMEQAVEFLGFVVRSVLYESTIRNVCKANQPSPRPAGAPVQKNNPGKTRRGPEFCGESGFLTWLGCKCKPKQLSPREYGQRPLAFRIQVTMDEGTNTLFISRIQLEV